MDDDSTWAEVEKNDEGSFCLVEGSPGENIHFSDADLICLGSFQRTENDLAGTFHRRGGDPLSCVSVLDLRSCDFPVTRSR